MFLSRVTLKHGPEFFRLFEQEGSFYGYVVHQLLWKLFPNDGTKKRDFIFRKDEKSRRPRFFLLSQTEPVAVDGILIETKSYLPRLESGQRLGFSLMANMVVSRKVPGKKNSAKHDVWMDAKRQAKEKQLDAMSTVQACENASKDWLANQGERCGFLFEKNEVLVDGYLQNKFYKKKNTHVQFSSINCEGILTVTDSKKFTEMLYLGIGKSKSFGCGLMLVRKM